jgi:hypothetical protein
MVVPVPITFANLTAKKQTAYQFELKEYQDMKKEYDAQIKSIRLLKDWIRKTVAVTYQDICCEPLESVKQWYDKLLENAKIDESELKAELRAKYKNAIKPLIRPKDATSWIARWEQVMASAEKRRLAVTIDQEEWFDDLLNAIYPVLPTWAPQYKERNEAQAKANTLSYRTIANDLRKAARQWMSTAAIAPKVTKGAFGPTYAGTSTEVTAEGETEVQKKGKKRTKANRKRQNTAQEKGSNKICRACGQGHNLERCWYVFTNRAPKNFTANPTYQRAVEDALKDDNALAEEVERLKKRMDTSGAATGTEDDQD